MALMRTREKKRHIGNGYVYIGVVALAGMIGCLAVVGCDDGGLVDLNRDDLALANMRQGIHRETVALGENGVLRYTLAVPFLPSGKKVPLVMALHQGGRIAPYVSEGYLKGQVEPALRDLNAIIVAPDIPAPSWIDPLSEEVILEFIDQVLKLTRTWPVDPDRIVLTGYSAGGIGTWYLTNRHPDVFSAGIPVAADPIVGDRRGADAVPLYIVHGANDEVFDVSEVAQAVEELQARGVPVRFVIAEDLSHNQTASYAEPMRGAVQWLEEEIWTQRQAGKR